MNAQATGCQLKIAAGEALAVQDIQDIHPILHTHTQALAVQDIQDIQDHF
jgi:hypothetical protein